MKKFSVDIIFVLIAILLLWITLCNTQKKNVCTERKEVDTIILISPSLSDLNETIKSINQDINANYRQMTKETSKAAQRIQQGNKKLLIIEIKLDSIISRISTKSANDTLR